MLLAKIKLALRWVVSIGSGALVVFLTYFLDALGAIHFDANTLDGVLLFAVVTGATKLVSWLIALIPKGETGDPPAEF